MEYIVNPNALDSTANTILLVKRIGDTLEKHYPGWAWAVRPEQEHGMIYVNALKLHGSWGLTLRIIDVQCDVHLRTVMRLAGELLERFGVPRGRYRYNDWVALLKDAHGTALPTDVDDKISPVKRRTLELKRALSKWIRDDQQSEIYTG